MLRGLVQEFPWSSIPALQLSSVSIRASVDMQKHKASRFHLAGRQEWNIKDVEFL